MPYDEDGNLIPDPEEDDPEGSAVEAQSPNFNADIAEYIRRQGLQSQMASSGGVASIPQGYSPTTIGPAETKYRQTQALEPLKQNFHPSGIRKVLGMIAGGASGSPDVRDNIINSQYNHAQGDFQQKLGVQEQAAKEEEAATSRASVQELAKRRAEAEVSRRGAEDARGARYNWMISPEGQKFELDKTRLQHPGSTPKPEYHEAELNDGSKVNLVRTPEGRLKNVDTGEVLLPSVIKQLSDPGKSLKSSNQFTGILAEDVQAHTILQDEISKPGTHPPATVEAAKAYIKARTEGRDPQSAFGSAQKAREDELGRKLTSSEIVKLQNQLQPIQKPPQALVMPPGGGEAMVVKPGTVVPPGMVTPTQAGSEQVATDKDLRVAMKARKDMETTYKTSTELANHPNATNDLALMFQFIGAVKPEALGKLRLNNNEINLVEGTRSLLGDFDAKVAKIKRGELLTTDQRQSMLGTMRTLAGIENTQPQEHTIPKLGDNFQGSKVKSIKQIK